MDSYNLNRDELKYILAQWFDGDINQRITEFDNALLDCRAQVLTKYKTNENPLFS